MPPKKAKPSTPSKPTSSKPTPTKGPTVIHWHRTDLRLHDSPSLHAALSLKPTRFIPIWTWDPHYVYQIRAGGNRWKFLVECMADLSESYSQVDTSAVGNGKGHKQRLWVLRSSPEKAFPTLFKVLGVTHLVFETDTDAYANERDERVGELAREAGVEVVAVSGRTLFDVHEVLKKTEGKPTMSMGQLKKATEKMEVARPLETVREIPGCGELVEDLKRVDEQMRKEGVESDKPPAGRGIHDLQKTLRDGKPEQSFKTGLMGPNHDCAVPTLKEMGISMGDAIAKHKGGETEALRLLHNITSDEEYVALFEKPASSPAAFNPQSTTLLSPHHHFGSLSVRTFYWSVNDIFARRKKLGKKVAPEPMNLLGQVLFRDMYFVAQAALGWHYAQTQGNKIARFIDWHLPSNHDAETGLLDGTYTIDSPEAEKWFRRWKEGRTGFPWIDALMRQLRKEGWIHHLGRHSVACFLTRGGCYVHWERGAEVFEEWLVDHEVACNVGNWMWLSCTAFYSQFLRCYSPIVFPKKYDPNGDFVREYIPELARFDKKYIYEPHRAPVADQKKWGCLIQGDGSGKGSKKEDGDEEKVGVGGGMKMYPKPMFDFDERRKICIDKIKKAYGLKMFGDDARVVRGEWKKIFGVADKKGGGKVMDEANGPVDAEGGGRGKRGRTEEDEGDDVDDDPEEEEEEEEKEDEEPPKKAAKENTSKRKNQGTLDSMVTRNKRAK